MADEDMTGKDAPSAGAAGEDAPAVGEDAAPSAGAAGEEAPAVGEEAPAAGAAGEDAAPSVGATENGALGEAPEPDDAADAGGVLKGEPPNHDPGEGGDTGGEGKDRIPMGRRVGIAIGTLVAVAAVVVGAVWAVAAVVDDNDVHARNTRNISRHIGHDATDRWRFVETGDNDEQMERVAPITGA